MAINRIYGGLFLLWEFLTALCTHWSETFSPSGWFVFFKSDWLEHVRISLQFCFPCDRYFYHWTAFWFFLYSNMFLYKESQIDKEIIRTVIVLVPLAEIMRQKQFLLKTKGHSTSGDMFNISTLARLPLTIKFLLEHQTQVCKGKNCFSRYM